MATGAASEIGVTLREVVADTGLAVLLRTEVEVEVEAEVIEMTDALRGTELAEAALVLELFERTNPVSELVGPATLSTLSLEITEDDRDNGFDMPFSGDGRGSLAGVDTGWVTRAIGVH